jgi:WD40 repeat protein
MTWTRFSARTGYPSTKMILGSLRSGETEVANAGYERLETHSPPYLVPAWTETLALAARYEVSAEFAVRALAFAGDYLVSAGTLDGAIGLHELTRASSSSQSMAGHVGVVLSVANLDNKMIASGGLDGTVRLWDIEDPGHWNVLVGSFRFPIRCLTAVGHGGLVAGVSDGGVYMLDATRRDGQFRPLGHHDGPVRGVSAGPDGCIVSASQDGTINVWDPDRPKVALSRFQHRSAFLSMAMTQAGQIVTADLAGQAHVWDLETSGCTARLLPQSPVRTVAIASGGQVICGCSDGTILLWEPGIPQDTALALTADRGAVWALATASNGRIGVANHDLVSVFQLAPIIGPDAWEG